MLKVIEVKRTFVIWWHNRIEGSRPLDEQLLLSKQITFMLEVLIGLEERGIVKVVGGSSWPSCVHVDVVDRKAYDQWYVTAGEAFGFPSRFLAETDLERREGTVEETRPPNDWDYEAEEV